MHIIKKFFFNHYLRIKMQKVPRHCLVSQSFFLEVTAIKVVCFCIYVYLSRHSSFPFIFKVIFLNKLSIFMFQNSKGINGVL